MDCWLDRLSSLKAGTHWPNHWTSEAFGETRTRSGINMFGVFSCVGSFWSRAEVVCSDSTYEVGILCALCFSMHSVPSFPVFMLRHPLIASRASEERTRYCGAGSTSKRCVECNFSVRQEATEWSDRGR